MSNYTGLHLDVSKLDTIITEFAQRNAKEIEISKKLLNPINNHNRYTMKMEEIEFQVDFFFKKDHTTTIKPQGKNEELAMATELCEYICEGIEYKDVPSGTFSVGISQEIFELLKKYLTSINGVKVVKNEVVNNGTGELLQLISDIGDKVTLTYFSGTHNLFFQGLLMKLHIEIKCFLAPYSQVKTTENIIRAETEAEIDKKVATLMKESYNGLDILFQDLLHDSIAQITYRVPAKDYSVWAFSALKALEGRIKQILLKNNVIINDKIGFSVKVGSDNKPIFIKDSVTKKFVIDTSIVNVSDGNTLDMLSECYTYFNKNRHVLFHTKQRIELTNTLDTPEKGEERVYKVCELFEESYKKLGY